MKNLLKIIALIAIAATAKAQDPCYVKYSYYASGNRIKREFICAPIDTIYTPDPTTDNGSSGNIGARFSRPISKELEFDFNISPNPTSGQISIALINAGLITLGNVYNNQGQVVLKLHEVYNNQLFALAGLSAGVYFVELKSKGKVVRHKFIKKE